MDALCNHLLSRNCPLIGLVLFPGVQCMLETCQFSTVFSFECMTIDRLCEYKSTVSPSLYIQWGNTPLLVAAENDHAEVVCFLLESGSVSYSYEMNSVSAYSKTCEGACPFLYVRILWVV